MPEGVNRTITDRDFVIATLVPPTVEVEETKPEEEKEEGESKEEETEDSYDVKTGLPTFISLFMNFIWFG